MKIVVLYHPRPIVQQYYQQSERRLPCKFIARQHNPRQSFVIVKSEDKIYP